MRDEEEEENTIDTLNISPDIINEKYLIKKELGRGAQGQVYLVENKEDKLEYAAKIYLEEEEEEEEEEEGEEEEEKKNKIKFVKNIDNIENECKINKKLLEIENPNILKMIECDKGTILKTKYDKYDIEKTPETKKYEDQTYLIFEYASEGDLDKIITFSCPFEQEIHNKYIFYKILKSIKDLHEHNIYHLDIKLKNILIDHEFEPKISDFGLSRTSEDKEGYFSLQVGTPFYCCPQIYQNLPFKGDKADIYSLGITLFSLIYGKPPFCAINIKEFENITTYKNKSEQTKFWKTIKNRFKKYNVYLKKELSGELKELFFRMVSFKEDDRPSVAEILEDKWFQEIKNLNKEGMNTLLSKIKKGFQGKIDTIKTIYDAKKIFDKLKQEEKELAEKANLENGEENEFFNKEAKPEEEKPGIFTNNYIIIDEKIENPINFMNKFAFHCYKKGNKLKANEEYLKFNLFFRRMDEIETFEDENKEDENDFNKINEDFDNHNINNENENNIKYNDKFYSILNDLTIQVILIKCKNGKYALIFKKESGELSDFYIKLRDILDN